MREVTESAIERLRAEKAELLQRYERAVSAAEQALNERDAALRRLGTARSLLADDVMDPPNPGGTHSDDCHTRHPRCLVERLRRAVDGGPDVRRRFRSRPSEIEAVQWTGTAASVHEVLAFCPVTRYVAMTGEMVLLAGKDGVQGSVPVPVGHWIVRNPGDVTDHWPVDPDYFARKYEEVDGE